MAFRKVSEKEWKKMGLPTSISTISFGLSKSRKPSTYTPRTSRNTQGATRRIPKWIFGRETLYFPNRKNNK